MSGMRGRAAGKLSSGGSVLAGLALSLLVAACASQSVTTATGAGPVRYLAWLEGDYQNSYRADRNEVAKRLDQLKDASPKDTDKYLEYLSLLDASGRSKEAEEKIKAYLRDNPKETRAAFLLGVHHLRQRRTELARYFFNRLEGDERFVWKSLLLNNLGMLALKEGKRFEAIAYFEKASKASPAIAAPLVNLGALYLDSQSFADAEQAFSRALDRDNAFEDAVLGRGAALEGMGQFAKAHDVYQDFLKKHPNAVSVLYNDGILLGKRLNQPQQAAAVLLRYVQAGGKETARAQELIQKWR